MERELVDLLPHSVQRYSPTNPTIGILICKKKDNFIVDYAILDINKQVGVAEYETKIVSTLPSKLKGHLPTIEDIEAELSNVLVKKKHKKNKTKSTHG